MRTEVEINLLLHVVLDYKVGKSGRKRLLANSEEQIRRHNQSVFGKVP